MRLFVDDSRPCPAGYECARDVKSAKLLLSYIKFDHVSLDYDLGYDRETGLDLLRWMKEEGIFVPHINVHSSHMLGRQLMWEFIKENFPSSKVSAIMI